MTKTKDIPAEEKILEAARQVFENKGMAGARMQEIADEAKINKSLLHYYYRSKQKLFEAVFKSAFNKLAPQINTILNSDQSICHKIKKLLKELHFFYDQSPLFTKFYSAGTKQESGICKGIDLDKNLSQHEEFSKSN